jgi:hypothetical protein
MKRRSDDTKVGDGNPANERAHDDDERDPPHIDDGGETKGSWHSQAADHLGEEMIVLDADIKVGDH